MNSIAEIQSSLSVIDVKNLSKKFSRNLKTSLKYGIKDIFSEITGVRGDENGLRPGEFWALNDINFSINKGEAVGLIGANGSGKTTLLKIISGLIKPDIGAVSVVGRVVPLIALGAGFNVILTGRENIYVNLAILGLTNLQIEDVFDDIVAFSEIGEAIDAPVQTYSSGMAARLGFSCAVHSQADILLIDEVLSVGDMRFRAKCYRKLSELRQSGTSFILVSHNTNAILSMCDRAIYLNKGKQIQTGEPHAVMSQFEEDLLGHNNIPVSNVVGLENKSDLPISIADVLLSCNEHSSEHLLTSSKASFQINIKVNAGISRVICSLLIRELAGESETVLHLSSDKQQQFFDFQQGSHAICISMDELGLAPGLYTAKIYLHVEPFYIIDAIESYIFRVKSNLDMKQCMYYQKVKWKIN